MRMVIILATITGVAVMYADHADIDGFSLNTNIRYISISRATRGLDKARSAWCIIMT